MKFAYFPGCNAQEISSQLDKCTRVVCEKLGIELVDFEDFSCCGSGALEDVHTDLNLVINARNFAIAEKEGLDIITGCSTCYYVMNRAKLELKGNELDLANGILEKQGLKYDGKVKVKHFSEVVDIAKIKNLVKEPLKLKIAAFYGCHMRRPTEVINKIDNMKDIIDAVGGVFVDMKSKDDCCGLHITLADQSTMLKMTGSIVNDAKEQNADFVVAACTLCHFSLDANQSKAEKYYGKLQVPILYLPQLIGLGLGIDKEKLGIDKNIVEFKNG